MLAIFGISDTGMSVFATIDQADVWSDHPFSGDTARW